MLLTVVLCTEVVNAIDNWRPSGVSYRMDYLLVVSGNTSNDGNTPAKANMPLGSLF
jgi:hypothetical protein